MTHGATHLVPAPSHRSRLPFLATLAVALLAAAGAFATPTDPAHRFERVGRSLANGVAILPMPNEARLLVADRAGELRLVSGDGHTNDLLVRIPDVSTALAGEGVLGMTWHAASPGAVLYVTYISNATPKKFTVAQIQLTQGRVTSGPTTIWSVNASTTGVNLGGGLAFSTDGKLLVGVGDQGTPTAAPQATQNIGKILRLNDDGTVPPDNPLAGRPFFALGVRNPVRLATDFTLDRTYFVDAHPGGTDELNVLQDQGNYGWPTGSGTLDTPPLLDPVKEWTTPVGPVGLLVYRGDNFKGGIPGTAVVATVTGRILSESWNGLTPPTTTESILFASGPGEPTSFRDMTVLPDGYMYVLTSTGEVWRLRNDAAAFGEPSSRTSIVPMLVKKDIFGQLVFDVEKKEDIDWYAVYDGDLATLASAGYSHVAAIDCHVTPMPPECVATTGSMSAANSAWYSLNAPTAVVQPPPAAPAPPNAPQYFLLSAQNNRGETGLGHDSNEVQRPGGDQVYGCPCPGGAAESPRLGDCREPWTLAQGMQSGAVIGPVTFDETWDCNVTLVDLSEGWCTYCHYLAEDLEAIWQDYRDNGFTLITLISETYASRNLATMADIARWDADPCDNPADPGQPPCGPASNPIILDENRRVMNRYFNASGTCNGWPQSLVFDADGVQTDVICGWNGAAARAAVERNLRAAGYIP